MPKTTDTRSKGEKISAAMRGNRNSAGRVLSAESRAKISAALKGNKNSLGRVTSKEERERKREAHKGRTAYAKGYKRSPEWCARLSELKKGNTHKFGKKDSPVTIARKRGAMLARRGRPVLPSPSPGIVGFVPDYRANAVVFFRP